MRNLNILNTDRQLTVGKIVCLGRNYAEHAKEMKAEIPAEPVIFIKPATALLKNGEDIIVPRISRQMHHEVELVVAVGKDGKNIKASAAMDHVVGYAVGLDMTLRDVQSVAKQKGLPWSVAKGFDTSAPVSDVIPKEMIENPHRLTICCSVNGTVRQKESTEKMLVRIEQIIEYISSVFTLEAGDLLFTGTPEGAGEVKPGDTIEATLVGYATTSHRVKSQEPV